MHLNLILRKNIQIIYINNNYINIHRMIYAIINNTIINVQLKQQTKIT